MQLRIKGEASPCSAPCIQVPVYRSHGHANMHRHRRLYRRTNRTRRVPEVRRCVPAHQQRRRREGGVRVFGAADDSELPRCPQGTTPAGHHARRAPRPQGTTVSAPRASSAPTSPWRRQGGIRTRHWTRCGQRRRDRPRRLRDSLPAQARGPDPARTGRLSRRWSV
jgi:hypothetical protein